MKALREMSDLLLGGYPVRSISREIDPLDGFSYLDAEIWGDAGSAFTDTLFGHRYRWVRIGRAFKDGYRMVSAYRAFVGEGL